MVKFLVHTYCRIYHKVESYAHGNFLTLRYTFCMKFELLGENHERPGQKKHEERVWHETMPPVSRSFTDDEREEVLRKFGPSKNAAPSKELPPLEPTESVRTALEERKKAIAEAERREKIGLRAKELYDAAAKELSEAIASGDETRKAAARERLALHFSLKKGLEKAREQE